MAGFIIGSRLRMHLKMEVPFVHFVSLSVTDKMTINAEYYIKTLRHNKIFMPIYISRYKNNKKTSLN